MPINNGVYDGVYDDPDGNTDLRLHDVWVC